MKKRTYIKRDKLIKELKDIYESLSAYAKIMKDSSDHSVFDISFILSLENLHDLIAKLDGTYKTFEQKINEIAARHLNDKQTAKVVEYKFKPVHDKRRTTGTSN